MTDHDRKPGLQAGFTLLEIIMVLLLVSVLSAVAIPRLTSVSQFEQRALQDQLLAELSYTRQWASAASPGQFSELRIRRVGDELLLRRRRAGSEESVRIPLGGIPWQWSQSHPASCSAGQSSGLSLRYNSEGFLDSLGGQPVSDSILICLGDRSPQSLCLTRGGLACAGNCR